MEQSSHPVHGPRYPRNPASSPSDWSRPAKFAAAAAIAAATVALAATAVRFNDRGVQWHELGFSDITDSSIEGSFRIRAQTDAKVWCDVEALNAKKSIVGTARVNIEPNGERTRDVSVTVKTSERPVTVIVDECGV